MQVVAEAGDENAELLPADGRDGDVGREAVEARDHEQDEHGEAEGGDAPCPRADEVDDLREALLDVHGSVSLHFHAELVEPDIADVGLLSVIPKILREQIPNTAACSYRWVEGT